MRTALIVLIALAALATGILTPGWLKRASPPAASELAAVAFPDLDGKPHLLSEWQGKVLIVNFWATWCPPCIEEMPEFVKLQAEFGPQGVQFVGVLTDDEADAAREFLKTLPVNYPILDGSVGGRAWTEKLGNRAGVLPFSAVFDGAGRNVHVETGKFTREEVLQQLKALGKP